MPARIRLFMLLVAAIVSGCAKPDLQVTLVIGEGLLIRSGDRTVLVDSFVGPRETRGDPELKGLRESMLAGHPPFSSIQLALVSHPHDDHFHAPTAGEFLTRHPETLLVSSPEVVQAILDTHPKPRRIEHQLREIELSRGQASSLTLSEVPVDLIALDHQASSLFPEQVLGSIIHLAGRKILITGDAEMRPRNWRPHGLDTQEIDVAVVPLWLFKEPSTRSVIEEYVAPRQVAVAQIPTQVLKTKLAELSEEHGGTVFLSTPMASVDF